MSTLAKLPDLLARIETLESGTALCRRRYCYAEAFTWLSPFCDPHQEPTLALFREPIDVTGIDRYGLSRYALLAEYRLGYGPGGLRPPPASLSPFVHISAC